MSGNVSGKYSTTDGMVSIPRVSENELSQSSGGESLNGEFSGFIDEMPDDIEGGEGQVFQASAPRQGLGQKIAAAFSGGFGASSAVFTSVNSAISKALSISPKVTSAAMSFLMASIIAVGGFAIYDYNSQLSPALWVGKDDCESHVAEAKTSDTDASSGVTDEEAAKLERAKKIFSVLKVYNPGLTNEHIAAILSNWDAECSLDETSIEALFDEAYTMGPKKKAAMADIDDWTRNHVWPAYGGSSLAYDFYTAPDGVARCGIGLGQQTGPNCKEMLDTAKAMNHDWYEFDWQLAYIIAKGGTTDNKFFDKGHFDTVSGSLSYLCDYVTKNYEGIDPGYTFTNGANVGETHRASSQYWLDAMKSWTVDKQYANSVISMIESMGGAAAAQEVEKQKSKCPECASEEEEDVDNSGIAQAAVTMAWPAESMAANNGTEIYQKVLPAVFNGDTYYKACDRVALSSVRWAGADDDFPSYTLTQIGHMNTSPIWEKVGDSPSESQLQPGDVMISAEHVFIYTGHEIIQKIQGDKPDASTNTVEGSLDNHSAHCETYGGFGGYTAYRAVKPQNSDKYKNVLDGYTFSNGVGKSENKNCEKHYDNSDLAHAFCMIAYSQPAWYVPYGDKVGQNPGTNIFWYVGHNVNDSHTWLNAEHACDHGVGIAVRFSGVDAHSGGGLGSQFNMYPASWATKDSKYGSEWQLIGIYGKTVTEKDLQPGDIMIAGGHTCMYVGPDIPVEVYDEVLKGTDADLGRPDGVKDVWVSSHHGSHEGWGSDSSTPCIGPASFAGPSWCGEEHPNEIYRCVKTDGLNKYVDIMDNYDPNVNYREMYAGDRAWSSVPGPLHFKNTH